MYHLSHSLTEHKKHVSPLTFTHRTQETCITSHIHSPNTGNMYHLLHSLTEHKKYVSPLTFTHRTQETCITSHIHSPNTRKWSRHMTLEIQVLAWDRNYQSYPNPPLLISRSPTSIHEDHYCQNKEIITDTSNSLNINININDYLKKLISIDMWRHYMLVSVCCIVCLFVCLFDV
jgi:hypothetical protein